jgi:ABC-2 type transport system permease protein
MGSVRIFFVGGFLAYRALFNWLSPWIFIPTLLALPIFQILLFTYIGRHAGVENDEFFVIGNAIQSAATPCLVAMSAAIAGERQEKTLGAILATPAHRVPMFLGRSLPVILNAWGVTMFALVVGVLLLNIDIPPGAWFPLGLAVLSACASCTTFSLLLAAVALRVRDTSTLTNVTYGVLLIAAGANVPLTALPGWLAAVSNWIPLTHAIQAARAVVAGETLGQVSGLLGGELALCAAYAVIGLAALRHAEARSRVRATLELV